ncbi:calcineurin B-like protein 7 [Cornus florida]|uniref:calcineurin B-like protein 7 n=1 Tax=Cornus florida TaxID=4283 RepID=UPI00289BD4F6|nr:calcineurin B-like protein 7 [Cornus florida]
MDSVLGCFCSTSKSSNTLGCKELAILSSETNFTVSEVEALYDLYMTISNSITEDDLINKEEFRLALFNNSSKQNLFADRVFELFDIKKNGVIEFEDFVQSLSIFHPDAPEADKISFMFRLYDLRHTGYIERDEFKEMLLARLSELDLTLSDEDAEAIVNKAMMEADLDRDGRIDPEEWKELVARNPSLIKNMTLPVLKEITLAFPNFVMKSQVLDSKLVS